MESHTIRQNIIFLLSGQELDARDLSQELGLKEKEIYEHLVHVERSVAASRGRFVITPSQCLLCGYVFEDRRRLIAPAAVRSAGAPSFKIPPSAS
jgi:predicted Zn-ribbon and HTH transcriptional regulator